VTKVVLISAVPPLMLKTDKNPGGLPLSVFDDIRKGVANDRSQFYKDLSLPFYGYNTPGAKTSEGVREEFWRLGMQSSIIGSYDCIKAFSETDQTEDLKKIDVPTLVIQGDADPNCAHGRFGAPEREVGQERDAQGDPRRAPWLVYHTRGHGQSGVAGIPAGIAGIPRRLLEEALSFDSNQGDTDANTYIFRSSRGGPLRRWNRLSRGDSANRCWAAVRHRSRLRPAAGFRPVRNQSLGDIRRHRHKTRRLYGQRRHRAVPCRSWC
jgi:hypothetical protein